MISGMIGGAIGRGGSGTAGVAAALPTASAVASTYFTASRYSIPSDSLPAGDWSIGGWFRVPDDATGSDGVVFNIGPSASPTSANGSLHMFYNRRNASLYVSGKDDAGNAFGTHRPSNSSSVASGLVAETRIPQNHNVLFWVQKSGTKSQLWLKFDGHAAYLAAEEESLYGAIASQTTYIGQLRDGSNSIKAHMRNFCKLSYALTKAQIDAVGNGTDPTTLGTPAATDWYYTMADQAATWTDSINSIVATKSGSPTAGSAVGYAPQTDAVFLEPVGPDGFVAQHFGGSANVALSGTYIGADGYDIEAQFLDQNNNCFYGWRTVAAAVSGGVWSGALTVPKGKRWLKVQLRKTLAGVASSDVMTAVLRWGVGITEIESGQSLADALFRTTVPYGALDVAPNGYITLCQNFAPHINGTWQEYVSITATADVSGEIKVTTQYPHGRRTGQYAGIGGVGGTTNANGVWQITVTSPTEFILDGSVYNSAWTSGGRAWVPTLQWQIPRYDLYTTDVPAALTIMANYLSDVNDCVVSIVPVYQSGGNISLFYDLTQGGTTNRAHTIVLTAKALRKVGLFQWQHGNPADYTPVETYFSSGGSFGAWTGYGKLGELYDALVATFPNSNFLFGVSPMTSLCGLGGKTAEQTHQYRFGMFDWVRRKIAAGNAYVFSNGWMVDYQPQAENTMTQFAHYGPVLKGYKGLAARLAHSAAKKFGAISNDANGPSISSAVRSGAVIDLTLTHNGGSDITWERIADGAVPTGFEVASDTAFTSKLTISTVTKVDANTLRITLASDPGATVYVRYMYGMPGDFSAAYMTPRITGVADNGAGLIRVTCSTTATDVTPNGSQKAGGHGITTGQWGRVCDVRGATQANGVWQFTRIDDQNVDLIGSSSVGLTAFTAGNTWQVAATGTIALEVGIPVYDNRTIGGVDTTGAPLQPTETYVTAA